MTQDELMWAAAWLHRATEEQTYLDDLKNGDGPTAALTVFSWDNKFLGAQVLGAKVYIDSITSTIFFFLFSHFSLIIKLITLCALKYIHHSLLWSQKKKKTKNWRA